MWLSCVCVCVYVDFLFSWWSLAVHSSLNKERYSGACKRGGRKRNYSLTRFFLFVFWRGGEKRRVLLYPCAYRCFRWFRGALSYETSFGTHFSLFQLLLRVDYILLFCWIMLCVSYSLFFFTSSSVLVYVFGSLFYFRAVVPRFHFCTRFLLSVFRQHQQMVAQRHIFVSSILVVVFFASAASGRFFLPGEALNSLLHTYLKFWSVPCVSSYLAVSRRKDGLHNYSCFFSFFLIYLLLLLFSETLRFSLKRSQYSFC